MACRPCRLQGIVLILHSQTILQISRQSSFAGGWQHGRVRKRQSKLKGPVSVSQVKTKGARRITFSQFADALALVAAKKGTPLADLAGAVLAADGPSVSGTRADYVKFHDDKVSSEALNSYGFPGEHCHARCHGTDCRAAPSRTVGGLVTSFSSLHVAHARLNSGREECPALQQGCCTIRGARSSACSTVT